MSKPIRFNREEIPLCPNNHGPMYLEVVQPIDQAQVFPVAEARAFCLTCRHTMIVADERPLAPKPGWGWPASGRFA